MDSPPAAKRALLALPVLAALLGCAAERTLTITSEPSDAAVRFGDEVIGRTPLTVPFVHYGVRRVTIYKPGYQTSTQRVAVEAPWYAAFPVDIVSEVLLPVGWKDRHNLHVTLRPGRPEGTRPDLRSVLDRAESLRRAGPDGPESLPPVQVVETVRGSAEPEPDSEPAPEPRP